MKDYNNSVVFKKFIEDLVKAKKEMSLVNFLGAGVSISQGYPDWNSYVELLLNFWIFKLSDLTKISDTLMSEVELKDINFLRRINSIKISNKRKVDIVHHIIRKYCRTNDPIRTQEIYDENLLMFEKYLFNEVAPFIPKNEIIDQLILLKGTFITTNYDNQIEKSFKQKEGQFPNVIDTILNYSIGIEYNSIIHLHGVPSSKPKNFISSSSSYESLYYKEPIKYRQKMNELFQNKNEPVVLFVGCSMEEDEVLSILSIDNPNIKFYALMKYNMDEDEKNNDSFFNEFISEYYLDNKNVEVIWYGDKYSDLPEFLSKKILSEIEQENQKTEIDLNEVRRILLGE